MQLIIISLKNENPLLLYKETFREINNTGLKFDWRNLLLKRNLYLILKSQTRVNDEQANAEVRTLA